MDCLHSRIATPCMFLKTRILQFLKIKIQMSYSGSSVTLIMVIIMGTIRTNQVGLTWLLFNFISALEKSEALMYRIVMKFPYVYTNFNFILSTVFTLLSSLSSRFFQNILRAKLSKK